MRQLPLLSVLLVSLAPLAACKDSRSNPPLPEPTGRNMSGALSRHMANCPSAVPGAITTVQPTADGVDVTITSRDPDAERRITALAQTLERPRSVPFAIPHGGLRTGGAQIGYCPITRHGATITTGIVPGGVRVHLRADSPGQIEELQTTVTARAKRLPGFASS